MLANAASPVFLRTNRILLGSRYEYRLAEHLNRA